MCVWGRGGEMLGVHFISMVCEYVCMRMLVQCDLSLLLQSINKPVHLVDFLRQCQTAGMQKELAHSAVRHWN